MDGRCTQWPAARRTPGLESTTGCEGGLKMTPMAAAESVSHVCFDMPYPSQRREELLRQPQGPGVVEYSGSGLCRLAPPSPASAKALAVVRLTAERAVAFVTTMSSRPGLPVGLLTPDRCALPPPQRAAARAKA
eukprot:scaffold1788_cov396-Prasinococcus_capsulatus_cf.AAC.6